jgi:predicted secreted protein
LNALVRVSAHGIAIWSCALLLAVGSAGAAARAQDEPAATPMRRIEFQVERTREVANDVAVASLRVTHDDVDPARLADRVNGDVRWATDLAKKDTAVTAETGAYYTSPIREKQRITGWTASQELVLTTHDTMRLTRLIAQLQERLQLTGLEFSVSLERRRAVEDELIGEALGAYGRRAELIRRELAAAGYELVYLSVNTSGGATPLPVRLSEAGYAGAARVGEPALEPGSSMVSVAVSATIELR